MGFKTSLIRSKIFGLFDIVRTFTIFVLLNFTLLFKMYLNLMFLIVHHYMLFHYSFLFQAVYVPNRSMWPCMLSIVSMILVRQVYVALSPAA